MQKNSGPSTSQRLTQPLASLNEARGAEKQLEKGAGGGGETGGYGRAKALRSSAFEELERDQR